VVGFDVDFEVWVQIVFAQKGEHGRNIEIVLVFGWFFWFGFDQELSGEANFTRVIDRHLQVPRVIVQLERCVRIEKRFIALPTAPEDVVFSAEFLGDFKHLLYLSRCKCEYIRVAGCCCTVDETRMRECVRCSPEQLYSRLLHEGFDVCNHFIKVSVLFAEAVAFGCDIVIVEAEVTNPQLAHKLKGSIGTGSGTLHRVDDIIPYFLHCSGPEGVRTVAHKGVPEAGCETEVVLHGFHTDKLFRIVVLKGEIV